MSVYGSVEVVGSKDEWVARFLDVDFITTELVRELVQMIAEYLIGIFMCLRVRL